MAQPHPCFPNINISADRLYHYATNQIVPPPDATVVGVFANNTFFFKPINAGNGIQVDETTTPGAITISYTGLPGLPYSYSTIPDPSTDATVVATMAGTDFRFKGFNEGTNIDIDDITNPNVITINGPTLASNVVVGSTSLVDAQVANEFKIKPLLPGNNTTLTPISGGVRIDCASYTASSNAIPGSVPITDTPVGTDLRFKPLVAGTGVILDSTTIPGAVIISAIQDTYSTVPSPQAQVTVVDVKVGNDFRFKGFRGGTNITVEDVSAVGVITINGPTYSTPVIPGTFPITSAQVGNDMRFRPLNPGTNIILDTTTLAGAVTINGPTLASSAGAGISLLDPQVGNEYRLKRLIAGLNIILDNISSPGNIIINGPTYSSSSPVGSFLITDPQVGNDFRFKSLRNGNNVSIDQVSSPGSLIINGPTLASTGVGTVSLVNAQVGNEFRIRTLTAGPNITLDTTTPGNVTISGPSPSVYTYSTDVVPGSDATVVSTQVGNNFGFKPFNNGTNIIIEELTLPGSLTINGPTYSTPNIPGTFPITNTQVGNDMRFRPLNSGTNVILDTTTLAGAITINGPTYSTPVIPGTFPVTNTQVGNDMRFRPLNAGTNTTLDTTTLAGAITINGPTLAAQPVVGGTTLVDTQVGSQFRIKQLLPGTNMTLDAVTSPGGVIINGPSLAATPSAGQTLVDPQVGNTFQIKKLIAGANMTLDGTTVPGSVIVTGPTPNVYTYSTDPVVGFDATVVGVQTGNNFGFKPLKSGAGISIDETSLPGAITITSLIQNVRINESIFVDAVFGDDATGARTEFSLPFETINAALAVALPGDTVVVRPGNYSETLTLLDQVNIVFNSGANLLAPLIDAIIVTGSVNSRVYSMGDITGRINILNHAGELYIQANNFSSNSISLFSISNSTTILDVLASDIITNNANLLTISSSPISVTRIASNSVVSNTISMLNLSDFGQVQLETVELQASMVSGNIVSASISAGNNNTTKLFINTVNASYIIPSGTVFRMVDNNTTSTPSPLSVVVHTKWLTTLGYVVNATSLKSSVATPTLNYPTFSTKADIVSNTHTFGNALSNQIYFFNNANLMMEYGTFVYDINTNTIPGVMTVVNGSGNITLGECYPRDSASSTVSNFIVAGGTSSDVVVNADYLFVTGMTSSAGTIRYNVGTLVMFNRSNTFGAQVTDGRLDVIASSIQLIKPSGATGIFGAFGTGSIYITANSIVCQYSVAISTFFNSGNTINVKAGSMSVTGPTAVSVVNNAGSTFLDIGTTSNVCMTCTGGTLNAKISDYSVNTFTSLPFGTGSTGVMTLNIGRASITTPSDIFGGADTSSFWASFDFLTSPSRIYNSSTTGTSYLNIGVLNSTYTGTTTPSITPSASAFHITGENWTISTINQPFIRYAASSTGSVNIQNVLFSNTASGTGQFLNNTSPGGVNVTIQNLTSTSSTASSVFNTTGGISRLNIAFLISLTPAYLITNGTMFLSTIKSSNTNSLEVIRVTGTATVEFTGSYVTTGVNAVIIDLGTASVTALGAKLSSTGACIFKSTAGLMNVFSAGSIGRVAVDAARITIQGSLLIAALLPS